MEHPLTHEHTAALREDVSLVCKESAAAILSVRKRLVTGDDIGSRMKQDRSPVSHADEAAHEILARGLPQIVDLPVVSEEGARVEAEDRPFWLVDPLDGTKEFLAGRDEFTVNVALVDQAEVRFGFVLVPVTGEAFAGVPGLGAWRYDGDWRPIQVAALAEGEPCRVVVSRSHRGKAVSTFLSGLQTAGHEAEERSFGSSLKLCRVATGHAHVYPRFGPTMHWDTAAAHGVLEGAGGTVTNIKGKPLAYPEGERKNPWFIAGGKCYRPWHTFISSKEEPHGH